MTYKRIVCLVFCLLAIVFHTSALTAAEIVFNADFESDTPGTAPSLTPAGDPSGDYITMAYASVYGNSVLVVEGDDIFPTNYLEIIAGSIAGPSAVYLYGYPDPALGPYSTEGIYEISWSSVKFSDGGSPLIGLNMSNGAHSFAVIYWNDGTIRVTSTSGFVDTGATFQQGISQDFRVIIDFDAYTFDLFIDEIQFGDDLSLRFPDVTHFRSFAMTVGYLSEIGIDDIKIIRDPADPVVSVDIDIKPGSNKNSINLKSKGVIPVAILTTDDFDATTVDPLSVSLGPDWAAESHGRGHIEDVDGDGDIDLMLHFSAKETGIACGDTEAGLIGETFDGQEIEGADSVAVVKCK